MKKMFFVILAAVLAIGFSAFTPDSKIPDGYYYQDGPNQVPVETELVETECPEGHEQLCKIVLNGSERQIRYADGSPVWRKFQN